MKKALIIVDYQYDYVVDDGRMTLGVKARNILPHITELATDYDEEDIYFTLDSHSATDWRAEMAEVYPETKSFPAHCVVGTPGCEIWGDIKGKENNVNHIHKHAYCPPHSAIDELVTNYDIITVVGVVTDICVLQTVIGLYTEAVNRGKRLDLVVDAAGCASFNTDREAWSLKYMSEVLSVDVINCDSYYGA